MNTNKYFGIEEFKEGIRDWGRVRSIIKVKSIGVLERECYEEDCTLSEANEAIENAPNADIFYRYRQNACTQFQLCSTAGTKACINEKNSNTNLPGLHCSCKEGYKGELCDIKCNTNQFKNEVGFPLTLGIPPSNYQASSTIGVGFEPKMAQHSRKMASAVYQFDNDIGWFDNIWMSKPDGQKWIQIDLGDIRTVKAILIRGGFYQGKECRPDTIQISLLARETALSRSINSQTLELGREKVKPVLKWLDSPLRGRYVKIEAINWKSNPACMAIEIYGNGGKSQTIAQHEFCPK